MKGFASVKGSYRSVPSIYALRDALPTLGMEPRWVPKSKSWRDQEIFIKNDSEGLIDSHATHGPCTNQPQRALNRCAVFRVGSTPSVTPGELVPAMPVGTIPSLASYIVWTTRDCCEYEIR